MQFFSACSPAARPLCGRSRRSVEFLWEFLRRLFRFCSSACTFSCPSFKHTYSRFFPRFIWESRRPTSTDRGFRGGTDPLERLGLGEASTARRQECLRYIDLPEVTSARGRSSVSPAARCPGTTSWRQFIRRQYMKKLSMLLTALAGVALLAPAAFAQGGEAAATGGGKGIAAIAVAIGMGVAAFGCGLGQGRIASAACGGMAQNPGAAGPIRAAMILGLVFVETLVLFTLVMLALKA